MQSGISSISETMNTLFRAEEVCSILGISRGTLATLIRRGELQSIKMGARMRISEDELIRYIELKKTISGRPAATNEKGAQTPPAPSGGGRYAGLSSEG